MSKFIHPLTEDVRFGLKGERTAVNTYGFVASDKVFHTKPHRLGSLMPFEITQNIEHQLNTLGLIELARRRFEGKSAPIDSRIEKAIHWLSVGLVQDEAETALVTMIVSLESLFTRGAGQSIASAVAESTAFLLGKPGDGRRRIAKHVHSFYKQRSSVAHGGSVVVSSSDMALLTYLVISSIRAILEKRSEILDPDGLFNWIDALKYG